MAKEIRNSRQTVTTVCSPYDPSTPVITPCASRPHADPAESDGPYSDRAGHLHRGHRRPDCQ